MFKSIDIFLLDVHGYNLSHIDVPCCAPCTVVAEFYFSKLFGMGFSNDIKKFAAYKQIQKPHKKWNNFEYNITPKIVCVNHKTKTNPTNAASQTNTTINYLIIFHHLLPLVLVSNCKTVNKAPTSPIKGLLGVSGWYFTLIPLVGP